MKKRIETKEDLLTWAKTINHGIAQKAKCDFQDVYARSQEADLNKFFLECVGDRALILCSVYNTMAYDEVERLLKVLVDHKLHMQMAIEYAELDKRETDLFTRERAFNDSKKAYHKRLEDLRKANESLEYTLARMKSREVSHAEQSRRIQEENQKYQEKSGLYDTIRLCLDRAA